MRPSTGRARRRVPSSSWSRARSPSRFTTPRARRPRPAAAARPRPVRHAGAVGVGSGSTGGTIRGGAVRYIHDETLGGRSAWTRGCTRTRHWAGRCVRRSRCGARRRAAAAAPHRDRPGRSYHPDRPASVDVVARAPRRSLEQLHTRERAELCVIGGPRGGSHLLQRASRRPRKTPRSALGGGRPRLRRGSGRRLLHLAPRQGRVTAHRLGAHAQAPEQRRPRHRRRERTRSSASTRSPVTRTSCSSARKRQRATVRARQVDDEPDQYPSDRAVVRAGPQARQPHRAPPFPTSATSSSSGSTSPSRRQ